MCRSFFRLPSRGGRGAATGSVGRAVVCLLGAGLLSRLPAAPKQEWLPVSPEELAAAAPQIEPDAPAEILFRKVEIDDRNYPQERVTREYIRYKVFEPEHIDEITRIAVFEYSGGTLSGQEIKVKLSGRLTLPNRTERLFGDESVRERNVGQSGAERNLLERLLGASSARVKERFLAISGVEAGAVLEYRTEISVRNSSAATIGSAQGFGLQSRRLGVRQLEYRIRPADPNEWAFRFFVLNKSIGNVSLDNDKKKNLVIITASNLPALPAEPLAPPTPAYYGLHFLFSYDKVNVNFLARKPGAAGESTKVDPRKTGPWSPFAIRAALLLEDRVDLTSRLRQRAAEITAGADGPLEKARRIHHHVQTLYARFREESKLNKAKFGPDTLSRTLDDLLGYDRNSRITGISPVDYNALAIALNRAAGLESKAIMLPNRQQSPFGRNLVMGATLPVLAVAVRAEGEWHFSLPANWPAMAFGALPWYCEGKVGLWVQTGNEEFEPIPLSGPEKSMIGNGGAFEVTAEGALSGEGTRRYTGHAAETLRAELINRDQRGRRTLLTRQLSAVFRLPGAETTTEAPAEGAEAKAEEGLEVPAGLPVTVTKVSGVDDPEAPIEVNYQLRIPGFAVTTAGRIIFRADVFRLNASSPFTASTRKLDVSFPYPWEELDVATIKLPPDCTPEFTEVPAAQPDRNLFYASQLRYNPEKQQLHVRREFACSVIAVAASDYAGLKGWYDDVARGDQREVVLTKTAPPATAAADAAPAPH